MNNKILYGGIALAAIVIVVLIFASRNDGSEPKEQALFPEGYEDITYTIDGKGFDLEDGTATVDGRTLTIFGEEAEGDITEDGMADIAFLLEEKRATSTAYYIAAAVQTDEAYRGTNGVLLGEDLQGLGLRPALGGVIVQYERPREGAASTAGTSTAPVRIAERFFVVVNNELQSVPLPE